MGQDSTTSRKNGSELFAWGVWFDPIEVGIQHRVRGFIEPLLKEELSGALGRGRHQRAASGPKGYRHGTLERKLLGSFAPVRIGVPRARLVAESGDAREWHTRYARMTGRVEALIEGAYLSGTNAHRGKRALAVLSGGAVGKAVVSRTQRKVRTD